MNARGRVGLFLTAVGISLLVASGVLWRRESSQHAAIVAEKAAIEDSARRVGDELLKTTLRYRAFQNSLPNMPDTVQRYGGVKVMEISGGYNKTIYRLEIQERDLKLKVTALGRRAERERARARAAATPVAAAGAAATLAGAVLLLVSRRRLGA